MQPTAVVEVMGGAAAVQAPVRSLSDLRAEIAHGLPVAALHKTLEHVYRDPAERRRLLYRVVPEGSYKRRVRTGQLTPAESEKTARLAHIIALAQLRSRRTEPYGESGLN